MKLLNDILHDKRTKIVLITVFAAGFIAHGYCYSNLLFSGDSTIMIQNDARWQISLGRFLQPLYYAVRGQRYPPFLIGFLSLLYISLAAILVVRMLEMKNGVLISMASAVMVVNVTVIVINATYVSFIDVFMLSMFFAVLGAALVHKTKKSVFLSPIAFGISLGIYQSMLQVGIFLLMILAVKDIFDGKSIKETFTRGLRSIAAIFSGLVLYYIALQIVGRFTSTGLSHSYNSLTDVGHYSGIKDILWNIAYTYGRFVKYFIRPISAHSGLVLFLNALIFVTAFGLLAAILVKKKIRGNAILLLAGIGILMPFGINIVCFISKGVEHDLMLYSLCLVYVFVIFLADYFMKSAAADGLDIPRIKIILIKRPWLAVVVLISVLLLDLVGYSNNTYFYRGLVYQNTLLTLTRVEDRMEQTDGYVVGETPVVFVGRMYSSPLDSQEAYSGFNSVATGTGYHFSVTYEATFRDFFKYILAYPINFESSKDWEGRSDVQEMPAFPAVGACKMIDGTMVVKLSD